MRKLFILSAILIYSCKNEPAKKIIHINVSNLEGTLTIKDSYNNSIILKENITFNKEDYDFNINSEHLPFVGILNIGNRESIIYLVENEKYYITLKDSILVVRNDFKEKIKNTIKECPELYMMDSLNTLIYHSRNQKDFENYINESKKLYNDYILKTIDFLWFNISIEKLFLLQEHLPFIAYSSSKNTDITNQMAKRYDEEFKNNLSKSILNESKKILEKMKKTEELRSNSTIL